MRKAPMIMTVKVRWWCAILLWTAAVHVGFVKWAITKGVTVSR